MIFRADLHCHTTCSDGSFTPEELVRHAKEIGLSGLSITDHDSVEAYVTALPLAKELNLPMISGVEFSTIHHGHSIHILGYAFDLHHPVIKDFCEKHKERRLNRNRAILKNLAAHNMPITEEDIEACTREDVLKTNRTIGRPHIALAMMKKGYVASVQDAFKKYLAEGKSCYAQGESFTTQESMDVIHKAKGVAIIAHPHLIDDIPTLRLMLEMNFDGIECYYAKFPLEQQERWIEVAKKKNLMITGGSDFHGSIKPTIPLGASYVGEELFHPLLELFKKNNPTV